MTEWSRYHREFQEISFIAAGGFGNVFKALHRLDGIEYAVKKIVVRSGRVTSIMQHLEEVKTLAKLNHTNIISYKGAWIEPTLPSNFVPSLPFPSHAQGKPSSIEHKRIDRYRSYASENINILSQSSSSSSWSCQSRKEKAENSKKINSRSGMYIHTEITEQKPFYARLTNSVTSDIINERFHELNTSTNVIGQRIVEENIASKNTEKTNSNSISFRSDSRHQDHKTENNTNYTDGTDSYDESNKRLCPYVPQVVRMNFSSKLSSYVKFK